VSDDSPEAIAALVEAGDDRAAYARMTSRLAWPQGKILSRLELARYVRQLGVLAQRRDSLELAELAETVVRDPDSPDRLYDLGYALIDVGAPAIAATVLWHCLALVGDSEEVVCELISALESALAYEDARKILEQQAPLRARSFLCRYLYAFNAAMSGDLRTARAVELAAGSDDEAALAQTIAGILARADQVDDRGLRGWHYVLTGGLLAHQSPYGFAEPMRGRYAYLADSLERVAFGLDRLVPLVRDLPCIYAPPGRNNEILALAAARRLAVDIAPWPAVGVPAPGLVVVYDLAELDPGQLARLVNRRPDQVLYAHASPWTVDSAVSPDVTTLLYQTLTPPWGEGIVVDPATQQISSGAPDTRSIDEIAAAISGSLPDEDLGADEPERWARLVAQVWPLQPAARGRLWAGGPVPSARFA